MPRGKPKRPPKQVQAEDAGYQSTFQGRRVSGPFGSSRWLDAGPKRPPKPAQSEDPSYQQPRSRFPSMFAHFDLKWAATFGVSMLVLIGGYIWNTADVHRQFLDMQATLHRIEASSATKDQQQSIEKRIEKIEAYFYRPPQ